MDKPEVEQRIVPSRGTHLIFKKGLLKENHGIIIPETKDGRLIFVINYFGHPMAGTTDEVCEKTHHCEPTKDEIDFIIKELRPYFGEDYDFEGNLLSSWAGLRPLVKNDTSASEEAKMNSTDTGFSDKVSKFFQSKLRWLVSKLNKSAKGPEGQPTSAISRNHVIEVSENGLVSLMGGKWTSFRAQGQETVERIIKDHPDRFKDTLNNDKCQTLNFNLIGSYSRHQLRDGFVQNSTQVFQ